MKPSLGRLFSRVWQFYSGARIPARVAPHEERHYRTFNFILTFSFIAHAEFVPIFHLLGAALPFWNNLACLVLDIACLALNATGRTRLASAILLVYVSYHTIVCNIVFSTELGFYYYFFVLIIIVYISPWKIREKIVMTGTVSAAHLAVYFFAGNAVHEVSTRIPAQVMYTINTVANHFTLSFAIIYFSQQTDSAEFNLGEANLKLQRFNEKLEKLSAMDPLTGLANRRQFDGYLVSELSRHQREGCPLSIIMCDIDYFKNYNDRLGHQPGDRCLQQVAAVLARSARRPSDLVARYGGEEFMLVLPQTDAAGVQRVAERIRRELQALALPHPDSQASPFVTLSLGLTTIIPDRNTGTEAIIEAADRALYESKSLGRNRLTFRVPEQGASS